MSPQIAFERSNYFPHHSTRHGIHKQPCLLKYVVRCAIWYHLHNLKNVKNTHERVLILVKLQASSLKPPTSLKLTLLHGCFSRFLICANGTKLRNASHISPIRDKLYYYQKRFWHLYGPNERLSSIIQRYWSNVKISLQWLPKSKNVLKCSS